ncbi:MAG TPA: glycosyltransferase, partial [Burkholderiales bacterium]|nr:glycosyltransferase [Burkholderiales bacterium]
MLRATAQFHGLMDRVHFIGPVQGIDKSLAYHAACLLVIPSRQEAMSIVVIEAGICGTPVLLTDKCGFDEIAASGGGEVVTATVDGVAEGLRRMLAKRSQLPGIGEKLRAFTRNGYLWTSVVQRYIKLFSSLLPRQADH